MKNLRTLCSQRTKKAIKAAKTGKSIEKQLKVLVFVHFSLFYNKNALTL